MHCRHRVRAPDPAGAELAGQVGEPGRQHRGVLGGELPGHPDLAQVPVRVLHRQAGLARTSQPGQGHHPRPGTLAAREPGIQVSEQLLPPGQECRPGQQPHRLARYHRDARTAQHHHLLDQLGEHPLDAPALQVGHVMVQLVRQRRQRPAGRPAEHDLLDEVTCQRLGQHAA